MSLSQAGRRGLRGGSVETWNDGTTAARTGQISTVRYDGTLQTQNLTGQAPLR
ncbi:MAG: hypothetical protein ACYCW6_02815 [Candidatus Xenobia bacterium]